MKCSLEAFKLHLMAQGIPNFQLAEWETKFLKTGTHAIVYARRSLSSEETN